MGHDAVFMGAIVHEGFKNISVVSKNGDDDYGLYTSNTSKSDGAYEFLALLKKRSLRFIDGFVCQNPFDKSPHRKAEMLEKLKTQLMNYRMHETYNTNTQRTVQIISGKCDENGKIMPGAHDDMAFGACFAALVIAKIFDLKIPGVYFSSETSFNIKKVVTTSILDR